MLGSPLVGSFILAAAKTAGRAKGLKARGLIGPGRDVGNGDGLREWKGEPESQKSKMSPINDYSCNLKKKI